MQRSVGVFHGFYQRRVLARGACCSTYLSTVVPLFIFSYYLRDAVSAVIATATWLAGWLAGWLSHSGIVSNQLNLSENIFDLLKVKAPSF